MFHPLLIMLCLLHFYNFTALGLLNKEKLVPDFTHGAGMEKNFPTGIRCQLYCVLYCIVLVRRSVLQWQTVSNFILLSH